MESIDEVLLEKEKELKEIQILKLKSMDQKLQERQEKICSLEQKIKEITIIKEAKDLEYNENVEKTKKLKQNLEEKTLNISFLAEENIKLQSMLSQKETDINDLSQAITSLKSDLSKITSDQERTTKKHEEELKYMTSIQLNLENTNEKLRNELEKLIEKYQVLTERCQIAEREKENIIQSFSHNAQEYDKTFENLRCDNDHLESKLTELSKELANIREKHSKRKKKDLKLKEKCENLEFQTRKITDENNSKLTQIRDKCDQELRSLRSQLEIKEIQTKTLQEEQRRTEERNRENERALMEKISLLEQTSRKTQEKVHEQTMNYQTKELEFNRNRQDFEEKIKNSEKTIDRTHEKVKELEKALVFTKQKAIEIEKENEILIQEVATYRKTFQNHPEVLTRNQQNVMSANLKSQNPINKAVKDYQDILNEENEVHSVLFSEDMGPATPLRSSPLRTDLHLRKSNFLSKSSEMELRRKIKELEKEKNDYKNIIENLAEEMQNVKSKLQLSQQLKDDNLLRIQILERENEDKGIAIGENQRKIRTYEAQIQNFDLKFKEFEEISRKKDQENDELKKNLKKCTQKINSLNEERGKLIEISQKMSAKLRAFENEESESDEDDNSQLENNKYSRKIRVLQEKLSVLEGEIMKWRELETKKNDLIDTLRKQIAESHKNPNLFPDFEKIKVLNSGDSKELDKFKEKLAELQAEIKKDVTIDVKKKPLIVRNEENLEKNQIYIKNSEKETDSQKKVEKMLQNKKSPNLKKKVRNYNNKI